MIKIQEEYQIRALQKLLYFVKFGCEDSDSREFAGSPIILEIMSIVDNSVNVYNSIYQISYDPKKDLIEENTSYWSIIQKHIRDTREWNSLFIDQKQNHVQTLIKPFLYKPETIIQLIEYGDAYHGSSHETQYINVRCNCQIHVNNVEFLNRVKLKNETEIFLWDETGSSRISAIFEFDDVVLTKEDEHVILDLMVLPMQEKQIIFPGKKFKFDYKNETIGQIIIERILSK
jgi:hypothetical protein